MDDQSYFSVETIPNTAQVKEPRGVYFHTNHLIFERTQNYQDQAYKNSSSMSRYKAIQEELKSLDLNKVEPDDFLGVLSSHKNAPYSPCRHPQGKVKGLTLGTAFYDLKTGVFRLYKGNPCTAVKNHRYVDFKF